MVREWMCFQGKRGKANYEATAIEEILPVELLSYDERKETPKGISIERKKPDRPILTGIDGDWSGFLFYSKLNVKHENAVSVMLRTHVYSRLGI